MLNKMNIDFRLSSVNAESPLEILIVLNSKNNKPKVMVR